MQKSKANINTMLFFGIFSIGMVLVLPLRVYQYLKIIEPGTGFYEKKNFSIVLMYVLLAVFCGAMFLLALIKKKTIAFNDEPLKKPIIGIICLLVSATLIIDAIIMSGNFSDLYSAAPSVMGGETVSNGLMKSGALPMLFEAFFAILSALYFVVLGLGFINGKSNGSAYKLLAIAPLAWCICRILHRFMRTISFINVSDLFFELFMLVFLMLFFMAFAQVISKVNYNGTDWKLFAFGLPSALFCLLCFVPRILMIITGKGSLLADQSPPEYCDFAVALFILSILISKVRIIKLREKDT